ncbi:hypothetical protein SLUN_17135 [Streptomyces lunaelactis]|uniref:Uncharacterized protein n=1 Tax=Streptomyces lunaelactis TaxID=1535768 RepID=A0A2R4T3G1_9ACTN|nr:hypothetical protein [Streptomyces lunaelactis]AVZ73641.1 hypothetical protein SLUN_17135 [Streptomyces lunaelactis]NUK89633.1 hypothetical protein [Streptomyces lunaelactis]NUL07917.1 hypothetical protein [Streptomyces lunaelactis]
MKIRHVRAIAVFGIAIVALTGARGSHGGSCGGGSSSSSHGSGDNNTTTSGGTTGSVTGGSSANKAERDVRIDECGLDATGKNLTAKITVTNSDSLAYKYDVSLQFKGDLGDTNVSVATAKVDALQVAAGASATGSASTAYTGSGDGSEYKKCEVVSATRTAS